MLREGARPYTGPMVEQVDERERGGQDLATTTLAEIYAQQGLLERARAIYERIAERAPDDPRIAERIESLSRAIREGAGGSREREAPAISPAVGPEPGAPSPAGSPGGTPDEAFEAWLARR